MPLYVYECQNCGHADDEFQHMNEDRLSQCPVCMDDTYERQVAPVHTTEQEFQKPIEMMSIALDNKQQIAAFQQRNPGVDVSTNPRDPNFGVPRAKSRAEKLRILKREGWQEKN